MIETTGNSHQNCDKTIKEGEIAFLRYTPEAKSFTIIRKWKEPKIVGFTKITVNNKVWRPYQSESSDFSMRCNKQTFRSLDQIRFFYPDNDNQTLESYSIGTDNYKKEEIFLPLSKGNKEVLL